MPSQPDDRDSHRLDGQLLSDLWIFRAAGLSGSMTAAAQRLGVTQGAVSQRVLRLEARLGVRLFMRQRSGMALTEAGKSLLGAMSDAVMGLNDALSEIDRVQRNTIVVRCAPSLAAEWLVPHLEQFYLTHPGIEVLVRSEMAVTTSEDMDNQGLDLAIDYHLYPSEGVHELAAVQETIFPVCAPAYRARLRERSGIVALHDDTPWVDGAADAEWAAWRRERGDAGLPAETSARHFNMAYLAYTAATRGQGVAMGRAVVVNRLMSRGELVAASEMTPVRGATYRIVTNRPGGVNSPVRRFARWWADAMAESQAATLAMATAADLVA